MCERRQVVMFDEDGNVLRRWSIAEIKPVETRVDEDGNTVFTLELRDLEGSELGDVLSSLPDRGQPVHVGPALGIGYRRGFTPDFIEIDGERVL